MILDHHRLARRLAPIALILATLVCASDAYAKGWEEIANEDGIVVHRKYIDGYELPVVKGKGVVKGSVYDILAVLQDIDRYPQWVNRCKEARLLKLENPYERVIYNQIEAPWPVSDRDAIVRSRITIDKDKKKVLISFRAIRSKLVPTPDDVVRVAILKGFYLLEWVDKDTTKVTYQAQADPGGLIPKWIIEQGSVEVPLKTIRNLRNQVKKTKAKDYKKFLEAWDPEFGGVGWDGDHPPMK